MQDTGLVEIADETSTVLLACLGVVPTTGQWPEEAVVTLCSGRALTPRSFSNQEALRQSVRCGQSLKMTHP